MTVNYQWEIPNPIKAFQEILGTMQAIEQNYFQAKKTEEILNNRQNDLLHALELDLDEEEVESVYKALREIRLYRRDIKDTLINLKDAQEFIVDNYKFMNQLSDIIKKMQSTTNKVKNRKYFLRDCEAMKTIIKMDKYSDIVHAYIPLDERNTKNKEHDVHDVVEITSRVDKFNSKWFK